MNLREVRGSTPAKEPPAPTGARYRTDNGGILYVAPNGTYSSGVTRWSVFREERGQRIQLTGERFSRTSFAQAQARLDEYAAIAGYMRVQEERRRL